MPIQPCELMDGTPPVARPFDFTRKASVEFSEFGQGLFQELWRLSLLTGAEGQIGLHTEIYPYALTCSRIGFGGGVVCDDIQPICANTIAKDLNIPDVSFPIAMLVKRKPAFIELQRCRRGVPFFERNTNTACFKFVARLKLRRTITVFAFELWTTLIREVEKSVPKQDADGSAQRQGYHAGSMPNAYGCLRATSSTAVAADNAPHIYHRGDNSGFPTSESGYAHHISRQAYSQDAYFSDVRVSDICKFYACIFVFAFVFS